MTDYYGFVFWTESIATFLIQLYIFYLLIFECTPEMKEYAYYLKLLVGYEFLHNTMFGILLSPRPIFPTYGYEVHGLARYFGIKFRVTCSAIVLYSVSMIVLVQLYCLIYRYLIFGAHKNLYYYFISTKCKIGIQIIPQSFTIGLSMYYYSYFRVDMASIIRFIKNWGETDPPIIPEELPVLAGEYPNTVFKIIMPLFFLIQIISFILLHLILKALRKNVASMTPETHRLYRQFTILLGAQLLTPLIFIFVLVSIAIVFSFFYVRTNILNVKIGYMGLLSYGLVNSLLIVLFITPFRRHAAKTFLYWWLGPLLKWLKCFKCLKWLKLDDVSGSTVTTVIPMHNHNI